MVLLGELRLEGSGRGWIRGAEVISILWVVTDFGGFGELAGFGGFAGYGIGEFGSELKERWGF